MKEELESIGTADKKIWMGEFKRQANIHVDFLCTADREMCLGVCNKHKVICLENFRYNT